LFLHLLTCVYIISPPTLILGRTYSALLFSDIVEEKIWKIRETAFLLVWAKDSYTGRFLVLFQFICVFQPILVHLCQISSLLPSPLPIVASASLRLLYLLLYSEHANHIQVFSFLPFPYPSCAWSSFSVWPMSNNITAVVLGL
jgi:hypothetical protein